jgi:hypothetical protein
MGRGQGPSSACARWRRRRGGSSDIDTGATEAGASRATRLRVWGGNRRRVHVGRSGGNERKMARANRIVNFLIYLK